MQKDDNTYNYQQRVAPKIRVLCKMMRISVNELSDKLGYSRKTVSSWVNGMSIPNIMIFEEICKILNVPIALMLSEEDLRPNYGNLKDCPKSRLDPNRRKWLIAHHRCVYCYAKLSPTYDYLACPKCHVKYLSYIKK